MNVFAIGDLHLPGGQEKPMDVFDRAWENHPETIERRWRETVGEDDLVLMPGDLSWAMKLEEAVEDLAYLGRLPGRIVMIRGNHDYWWGPIGRVRRALPPNVEAIQNDHVPLGEEGAVCGSRGWVLPGSSGFSEEDETIYRRELARLALSLESARKAGRKPSIVMLHYPPLTDRRRPTEFTRLLQEHGVRVCVYGHLHGKEAHERAVQGVVDGVEYVLASCDAIDFSPLPLLRTGPKGSAEDFVPLPGSPLQLD